MFNIDFNRLILWLIPAFLRRAKLYAWLQTLCSPVVNIYDEFIKERDANLYKLSHNSQVFSLEKVMNDKFDSQERRIYISDGFTKDRIYIHRRIEDKPVYLHPIYLHNRGDYADTGVDFIVWIPWAVFMSPQNLVEAKALIDFYKLAGKRYKFYRV